MCHFPHLQFSMALKYVYCLSGSAVLNKDDTPLIVKAFDYDTGPNGLVNYRVISPLESYFTVDFVSGAIRTKAKLDFEVVSPILNF